MDRRQFTSAYVSEFTCAICLGVPDGNSACFASPQCQHVFCQSCLVEWLKRSPKCPTCNRDCSSSSSPPLVKHASALAFRLLNRMQVKCSLQKCDWIGDFANLEAHLTNSDTHVEQKSASTTDYADELRLLGNERYAQGKYVEAIKLYDKALLSSSSSSNSEATVLLSNKAAALIKLERFREAAEACERAVNSSNNAATVESKVLLRWASALTSQFDFGGAISVLNKYSTNSDPKIEQTKRALQEYDLAWHTAEQEIGRGEFTESAQRHLAQLLRCADVSQQTALVARASMVEAHVGDVDLALRLSLQCCRKSPKSELAWTARAYALCSAGELGEAVQCGKQALRLDPDNPVAKRCFKHCRMVEQAVAEARALASQPDAGREPALAALGDLAHGTLLGKSSPLRVQLLAERGNVSFQAGKYELALRDCDQAIALKPDCQRAWLTKFYCLRHLERFREAHDMGKLLLETWGSADAKIKSCCERAEFDYRKHKRPDLYQALGGLSSLASEVEIKQAYKRMALLVHPDKAVDQNDRSEKEEQFKLLGQALEILGNQETRELYDKGHDLAGIKEELERRKRRSPHHH